MTPPTIARRPEDAGIDSDKLNAVFARVRRDIDDGVLPSAQVAVARNGVVAGMCTFGTAVQGGRLQPATNETLYSIFSCTKAIVAAAVWTLFEDGLLAPDEAVAGIIPKFAANGKDAITVEQVMLHTSGFPRASLDPRDWHDRDKRARAFASWPLEWQPDTRFEYHAVSAHWVLAQIIERRTGTTFQQYIRGRILDPLGLDSLYVGLPRELHDRVAEAVYVEPPSEPPDGWGVVSPQFIESFNEPAVREVGVPGAGGVGTAGDLALFYQALIGDGAPADRPRILQPETIAWATRVRSADHHRDPIEGIPVNRALGVVVAGDDGAAHMRGFGRATSAAAFGHGGAGGQIAWVDPRTGISLGYCTNGFTNPLASGRRMTAIGSLAAVCALPETPS
jgi:CubicO group peptidase (beta-lactamase class C family)